MGGIINVHPCRLLNYEKETGPRVWRTGDLLWVGQWIIWLVVCKLVSCLLKNKTKRQLGDRFTLL